MIRNEFLEKIDFIYQIYTYRNININININYKKIMQTLDIKTLIGLGRLSVIQVEKFMDHYDYKLRNAEVTVFRNNLEYSRFFAANSNSRVILKGIKNGIILISIDNGKEQELDLGKNLILIIFAKTTVAVYND